MSKIGTMKVSLLLYLIIILIACWSASTHACDSLTFTTTSYHMDRSVPHNEVNPGVGCNKRMGQKWGIGSGIYYNSHWKTTLFLGTSYYPYSYNNWRFGGTFMLATGYDMPVTPIPMFSIKWKQPHYSVVVHAVPAVVVLTFEVPLK